jgi:hypothetical protein
MHASIYFVYNSAVTLIKRKIIMKTKNILLSMVVLAGSLSWGGASASSSHAEMRAYYVDPGNLLVCGEF